MWPQGNQGNETRNQLSKESFIAASRTVHPQIDHKSGSVFKPRYPCRSVGGASPAGLVSLAKCRANSEGKRLIAEFRKRKPECELIADR